MAGLGTVLLVEDEADIQLTVRLALELSGFDVVVTPTAEQALDILSELEPAAVMLDITLPGMDGWSLLQLLGDQGRLEALRVVVVSAHVSEEVAERAKGYGARFLTKPFEITALRKVLGEMIGTDVP